jgi:hypothetical protein
MEPQLQFGDDDSRLTGGDAFGGNALIDVIQGNGTDDFLLTTGRREDAPTTTGTFTYMRRPHFVPYFSELCSRLLPAALGNLCSSFLSFYGKMDSWFEEKSTEKSNETFENKEHSRVRFKQDEHSKTRNSTEPNSRDCTCECKCHSTRNTYTLGGTIDNVTTDDHGTSMLLSDIYVLSG